MSASIATPMIAAAAAMPSIAPMDRPPEEEEDPDDAYAVAVSLGL